MEATSPVLLVVEHDPGLRGVLCAVLRRAGYRVEDAPRGSAGLARIEADGVGLILLEHDLVDMESLELCRRLHQDDRHAALPVLLLTGWQDHLQRQAAVAAGVDDFV